MAAQPSNRKLAQGYAISTAVGGFYGATNTIVGHPFDTVKTKMQAQSGYAWHYCKVKLEILRAATLTDALDGGQLLGAVVSGLGLISAPPGAPRRR